MAKKTIGNLLLDRVKKSSKYNAIGCIEKERIKFLTFSDYKISIENYAVGLRSLGLKQKEKVAILAHTRMEWNIIDLAIMSIGAITVPIYPSYTSEEIEHILSHCEAKFIIVENLEQFSKLSTSTSVKILSIDSITSETKINSYKDLIEIGEERRQVAPDQFELAIANVLETDVATIVYTSGTTGLPKGAIITQKALCKVLDNIKKYAHNAYDEQDRFLTFLPLSHVLGRCESFFPLVFGSEAVYAQSIDKIIPNMKVARPTLMVAVPRIFEKVYEKVQKSLEASEVKKLIFEQALGAADSYFKKIDKDKSPSFAEVLKFNLAQRAVFDKVYAQFGGRVRFFISGGAPLSPEIIKFLRACNLTILEGYGLTETIAPCTVNPMEKQIPGTVGRPIGDVEITFSEDSEILIKSEALFSGYYKDKEATDEVLDENGWFHTGDLGQFTNEGFLKITGRKKDLIITSGGKNVAPQKIEGKINLSPLIAHSVVIGDQKKYLTALVFIDKEAVASSGQFKSLNEDSTDSDFESSRELHKVIAAELNSLNSDLASFETIKNFKIIACELSVDNYLTPSLKVKKNMIKKDFESQIEAMYQ